MNFALLNNSLHYLWPNKGATTWFNVLQAFLLCLLVHQSTPVWGQDIDRFTISGQLRHRTEFDARDLDQSAGDVWFHLLRTRVGLGISASSDVSGFIQLQDSRVFGSENEARGRGTLDGSAPNLDVHQAYFRVQDLFNSRFSLQIGRQELVYGNQRLIGSVGWSNIGRSFDAGVLSYAKNKTTIDLFLARLVGNTTAPFGQNLYGVYATSPVTQQISFEAFLIADNNTEELAAGPDSGKSLLSRYTLGGVGRGASSNFDFELELMYQGGAIAAGDSSVRTDINAYLLSGALGYSFENKAGLKLQYTTISGNRSLNDNESNAFNTLFATNHKFYGFMDLFPRVLAGRGLHDVVASFRVSPAESLQLRVDLHHFLLDQAISGENVLGQEIDVTSTFQYNSSFSLQAGVSAFIPGQAMDVLTGNDSVYWLYVMSSVNF